jgi:magnesium transporter
MVVAPERRAATDELRLFLFAGDKAELLDRIEDVPTELPASSLLWIDGGPPSAEDAGRIAEALDLGPEAAAALEEGSSRERFRDCGSCVLVSLAAPDADRDDSVAEVECLVGRRWVVTWHEHPIGVLDELADLARGSGPTGELDGPSFLAMLVAWVLKEYDAAFDRLEEELEAFDEKAMRGHGAAEDHIESLVDLRRRAGRLRRALSRHRGALLTLTHPELEALGDETSAERFRELLATYETAMQTARDARTSIVSSFDVVIARTGHHTNEVMKVLTLASVILLPGALLAGVMGMNFKVSLFTHPTLFWVVLGVIVLIGVVTLAAAKTRKWI